MRKPRDIDAELKALQDKQRSLKLKRITQFGELVTATGGDALDLETLAGALLDAVTLSHPGKQAGQIEENPSVAVKSASPNCSASLFIPD